MLLCWIHRAGCSGVISMVDYPSQSNRLCILQPQRSTNDLKEAKKHGYTPYRIKAFDMSLHTITLKHWSACGAPNDSVIKPLVVYGTSTTGKSVALGSSKCHHRRRTVQIQPLACCPQQQTVIQSRSRHFKRGFSHRRNPNLSHVEQCACSQL